MANTPLCADSLWTVTATSENAVFESVDRVVRATQPPVNRIERRKCQRTPFPHLLTLTPVANDRIIQVGEPIAVVGKQLSPGGLDFYHCQPIDHRRVIVSFDDMPWDVNLVLSINWCRFLKPGWYDSGGRFTHIVSARQDGDA